MNAKIKNINKKITKEKTIKGIRIKLKNIIFDKVKLNNKIYIKRSRNKIRNKNNKNKSGNTNNK